MAEEPPEDRDVLDHENSSRRKWLAYNRIGRVNSRCSGGKSGDKSTNRVPPQSFFFFENRIGKER